MELQWLLRINITFSGMEYYGYLCALCGYLFTKLTSKEGIMKKWMHHLSGLVLIMIWICPGLASAVDTRDTRLLSQPAMSADRIAFIYAGDLWTVNHDGKDVKRLTADAGNESNPVFSPNGQWIAFSAEYDGNTDVFIIPTRGGIPKRLTYHPSADVVCDFSPDGKSVMFRSPRFVFTRRYNQFFTVDVDGGFPQQLQIPYGFKGAYSPGGEQLAYVPNREVFHQWKNYRGGTHSQIWIYNFSDHQVEKIPQPADRCNDTDPVWNGSMIYFRSDRDGEFNLYVYDSVIKDIKPLTTFTDFPVLDATFFGGKILFEQGGYFHFLNPENGQFNKLTIGVAADLLELRPRFVNDFDYVREMSISPSGARATINYRGEIISLPAEKGDARNLTKTPGIHERSPAWSPDGKSIAYFSDASGEVALHIQNQVNGQIKKIKLNGAGFYAQLHWSPDSKKLTFADNGRNLYWLDVAGGNPKQIAQEPVYMPGIFGSIHGEWSPDSQWIVYTVHTKAYFQQVYVYNIETGQSTPITDGLSEVSEPVFDASGKYLYFFVSTDAGPVKHWFAQSSRDMESRQAIYLATLQKETLNPLAKESDEEKTDSDEKEGKSSKKKKNKKEEKTIQIDFDGLENRIVSLSIPPGSYRNLQTGDEGQIFFIESIPTPGQRPAQKLHKYDLKKKKDKVILSGSFAYQISSDKKKILHRARNGLFISKLSDDIKSGKGKLNTDAVQIRIDPKMEWTQIYNEAWRINRDYFYDPNFHGADWPAMREKYEVFLPHLSCRDDLNRVIMWMCSELGVGHHRVRGGDYRHDADPIPGGLLGADYEIAQGRYRFKKVYGGLNWNPNLQSPLRQPGVDVKAGEYLLAINGKDIKADENLFSRFEYTAGKIVKLTVGPNPDLKGSRTVQVVPIRNEASLRNRDWVEGNIKKVDKATDGRIAYVYVPNTTTLGHTYFKRYFFPQTRKEGIIIDERFNGGGLIADYYIDHLRRPFMCNWNMRYGDDLITPSGAIFGPKVMIIDENAGSGGDMLPWMFHKLELGKLIGKRTWGGLVGTLGFPVLMDGGYVSAPNLAIWTEDGFIVENVGVPPDIDVEQTPALVIQGQDPQLERAIEEVMKDLEKNPFVMPKRPPYPIRVKK